MSNEALVKALQKKAQKLRLNVLEMIGVNVAGHWGGSSSLAETMAVLYFHVMNADAKNPNNPVRDRLLLSKGHAALIQYAALCEADYFPREELQRVKELNGLLQGHPDLSIPGIEAVTGSLGQGLSIGVGMALALRLDKKPSRVYVIGHTGGGGLEFSFQDNELLDHEGPRDNRFDATPCRLHYRAPTEKGNSGSPVFNAADWKVIALHHAGGTLSRLNGKPDTYPANEGIALLSIISAMRAG